MGRQSWRRLAAAFALALGITTVGATGTAGAAPAPAHTSVSHRMVHPAVADWWV